MRTVSDDLKNAGRIDGLSEYAIFFRLVLPLVRPAMATVAVFTMIPIWNDLWFPLILAPAEATKTVTLGAQIFIGQFVTNWNAVLAALSLAILPVLVLYRHLLAAADPRHHRRSREMTKPDPRPRRRPRQYGPQPCARLSQQSRLRDRRPRQPLDARAAAPSCSGYTIHPDFTTALRELKPDLCSINTYSDSHADLCRRGDGGRRACLRRKAAGDHGGRRRARRRLRPEGQGRKLVVGYILRHHPSWMKLIAEARKLGGPLCLPHEPQPAVQRPDLGDAQGADADDLADRRLRRALCRRDVPDHRCQGRSRCAAWACGCPTRSPPTCTITATSRCCSTTARSAGTRPAGGR